MKDDLSLIKKYYGEKMAHLCRELFPTILETNGLLFDLLLKRFNPSKFLYDDIIEENKVSEFKCLIYSLIDKKEANRQKINKTPFELLDEAGYELFECTSEKDIEKFKKYYKKDEELCTFRDNRLKTCYVFFAVKKNVDKIKREDFKEPKRQDEYGTSVISIQFSRDNKNTLSIKNRYNHTVSNPDATFSNNLDNIIPRLTESFNEYYNFNINSDDSIDFELNNYVVANDGKYYRYNYEINNIYYCPDNIIIDNFDVYTRYSDNKERYIVLDYFLLDLKDKIICKLDDLIDDCFSDIVSHINKIKVEKVDDKKIIQIIEFDNNHIKIVLDKYNRIIEYCNDSIKTIYNNFLRCNETLKSIKLPEVREIGGSFLYENDENIKIDFPNLLEIGYNFLRFNRQISKIRLPQVKKIGYNFMAYNKNIVELSCPNLEEIGEDFLVNNLELKRLEFPKVVIIGKNFLYSNEKLTSIILPNVEEIKSNFIHHNHSISFVRMPELKKVGHNFLCYNESLSNIEFPKLEIIGHSFMFYNKLLNSVYMPNVIEIGDNSLYENNSIYYLNLPKVLEIGTGFMYGNRILRSLKIPKVKKIGGNFLYHNIYLEKIDISDVETISFDFLPYNEYLKSIDLPNVERISKNFLSSNKVLSSFNAPCLKEKKEYCFYDNPTMQEKVDEIISNNQRSVTKKLGKEKYR